MSSAVQESKNRPKRVGVYRIEEEIGSGAMGKVYRATHETLGKEVALKILHADGADGELQDRFVQEGIAASRVRHPNVVEILDAGKDGSTSYLAMQLLEGETLADCLKRQGRLPITYAVDLILPVCAALVAAHDVNVLHRDLKPANIFLNDVGRGDPEPMLLDFGISKILGPVDAALTQNPRFLGTPFYIAPEQADGAEATVRSDQYSLALTLYEALLGVRPFEKFKNSLVQLLRHVAEGDIRPLRSLDPSVSADLDEAICRALHQDPAERFASVREFGAALLPFASAAHRTLWQHSFVDAERTMTSVNAPVSDHRSSRRIEVSVERRASSPSRPDEGEVETGREEEDGDFLTHSLLFGSDDESSNSFDPEKSTISRRHGAATVKHTEDDYSQRPSGKGAESWNDPESGLATDPEPLSVEEIPLERVTKAPRPKGKKHGSQSANSRIHIGAWGAAALALLLLGGAWRANSSAPKVASQSYSVVVEVEPTSAQIKLDGQLMGSGRFQGSFQKDGQLHRLSIQAPGYISTTVAFQDKAPAPTIRLAEVAKAPKQPTSPPERSERSTAPQNGADSGEEFAAEVSAAKTAPPRKQSRQPKLQRSQKPKHQDVPTLKANAELKKAEANEDSKAVIVPAAEEGQSAPPGQHSIPTGNLDPWAK